MSQPRITEILEYLEDLFAPVYVAPDDQETTDAYADVDGSEIDSLTKGKVCYTITNADDTNSIDWKVLASIDGETWVEVEAEDSVAAEASDSWEASATEVSYRYFKVQVKSTVSEAAGIAQVRGYAKL
jgi:hypothetical protein